MWWGANIKDMLEDRETLLNAVSNSHDKHVEVMDKLESRLVQESTKRNIDLVNRITAAEFDRNRNRVNEILHLVDLHFGQEFERLVAEVRGGGYGSGPSGPGDLDRPYDDE